MSKKSDPFYIIVISNMYTRFIGKRYRNISNLFREITIYEKSEF